jgi:hypothetical protein
VPLAEYIPWLAAALRDSVSFYTREEETAVSERTVLQGIALDSSVEEQRQVCERIDVLNEAIQRSAMKAALTAHTQCELWDPAMAMLPPYVRNVLLEELELVFGKARGLMVQVSTRDNAGFTIMSY